MVEVVEPVGEQAFAFSAANSRRQNLFERSVKGGVQES
jgi:hypothetical protein